MRKTHKTIKGYLVRTFCGVEEKKLNFLSTHLWSKTTCLKCIKTKKIKGASNE